MGERGALKFAQQLTGWSGGGTCVPVEGEKEEPERTELTGGVFVSLSVGMRMEGRVVRAKVQANEMFVKFKEQTAVGNEVRANCRLAIAYGLCLAKGWRESERKEKAKDVESSILAVE